MSKLKTFYVFLLIPFLWTCQNGGKTDPLLEEASGLHQEAMNIKRAVQDQLEKSPLTAKQKLSLLARLEQWDNRLVEVPGFEHDHGHGHDHDHQHHDHDHGPAVEVTPEHMLAIQKESLDSILSIQQDLVRLAKK